MRVSLKAYARSRGADPKSIRRAIAAGIIQRDADGMIDEQQADESWGRVRRASRMGQHQNGEAGEHAATAKIAVAAAKIRLASSKFTTMDARYADRQHAIVVARAEAAYFIDSLRAAPGGPAAETFAQQLGIEVEHARAILRQFVELVAGEIGDLQQQAQRDAELS